MLSYLRFPEGITLVYGPPGSGKSTLCLQIAANNPGKIFFIDTENACNVERLQLINPLVDLSNIIVFKATRYSEQYAVVKRLQDTKNCSLILIDSFTKYHRRKAQEKTNIRPATIKMLHMLKELHIPVVLTSQIYTDFHGRERPIAYDLFRRFAQYTLKLENKQSKRTLTIEQTGVTIPFIITEKGLVL